MNLPGPARNLKPSRAASANLEEVETQLSNGALATSRLPSTSSTSQFSTISRDFTTPRLPPNIPLITLAASSISPSYGLTRIISRTLLDGAEVYILEHVRATIRGLPLRHAVPLSDILEHVSQRELERFEADSARVQAADEEQLRHQRDAATRTLQTRLAAMFEPTIARRRWEDVADELEVVASQYVDAQRYRQMLHVLQKELSKLERRSRAGLVPQVVAVKKKKKLIAPTKKRGKGRPRKHSVSTMVSSVKRVIADEATGDSSDEIALTPIDNGDVLPPPTKKQRTAEPIAPPRSPELAPPVTAPAPAEKPPDKDAENDEDTEYTVELILAQKRVNGTRYYLTKWEGYDEPDWQPSENFEPGHEAVSEFLLRVRQERRAGLVVRQKANDKPKPSGKNVNQQMERDRGRESVSF